MRCKCLCFSNLLFFLLMCFILTMWDVNINNGWYKNKTSTRFYINYVRCKCQRQLSYFIMSTMFYINYVRCKCFCPGSAESPAYLFYINYVRCKLIIALAQGLDWWISFILTMWDVNNTAIITPISAIKFYINYVRCKYLIPAMIKT